MLAALCPKCREHSYTIEAANRRRGLLERLRADGGFEEYEAATNSVLRALVRRGALVRVDFEVEHWSEVSKEGRQLFCNCKDTRRRLGLPTLSDAKGEIVRDERCEVDTDWFLGDVRAFIGLGLVAHEDRNVGTEGGISGQWDFVFVEIERSYREHLMRRAQKVAA